VTVVPPLFFLLLAMAVFLIGMLGFLTRRSLIQSLMCLELMAAAVSLTFLAVGRWMPDGGLTGMVLTTFTIVIGAAETGMGLAIVILYFRRHGDASTDDLDLLGG
jgi:NADH-quinone oxidoreductase subunit K